MQIIMIATYLVWFLIGVFATILFYLVTNDKRKAKRACDVLNSIESNFADTHCIRMKAEINIKEFSYSRYELKYHNTPFLDSKLPRGPFRVYDKKKAKIIY